MSDQSDRLADLVAGGRFETRLNAAVSRMKSIDPVVGISLRDRIRFFGPGAPDEPRPLSCVTKLLTAALAMAMVREGSLSLAQDITTWLPPSSADDGDLIGIRVKHLLEHTHGVDEMPGMNIPVRRDLRIDDEQLVRSLRGERLFAPGHLYSYGDSGMWLAGCLMEKASRSPFERLLAERILRPLGIPLRKMPLDTTSAEAPVCPSTGGPLGISPLDTLRFLTDYAGDPGNRLFDSEFLGQKREAVVPFPGWFPLESGIFLGWKHLADGWFGHSAKSDAQSWLVRLHPAEQAAIVISTKDRLSLNIAAQVFGGVLREFGTLKMPTPLNEGAARNLEYERYVGTFGNRSCTLRIAREAGSGLYLSEAAGSGDVAPPSLLHARLIPCPNNMFLTDPPDVERFPFIQLISLQANEFRHLWAGQRIWKASH